MSRTTFNIYGDNIVECVRAFDYVVASLGDLILDIEGPGTSVTCPVYVLKCSDLERTFQFLPGYGEHRWNQDVLDYVKRSGGRLREAADAIITVVNGAEETAVAAIEFCGALPAGNQAWQRQGRAFSFALAAIPFFYVAELGGFELSADRGRKAERMPNPAVPFSFLSATHYQGSVCLPVYEANAGATKATIAKYGPIYGKATFLEFIRLAILGNATAKVAAELGDKCVALVELLAGSKKRKDSLSSDQWSKARTALLNGENLLDYLASKIPLPWKKTISIGLTTTASRFMALGAEQSLGITSTSLPLSFVPKDKRDTFSRHAQKIYGDLQPEFVSWLASDKQHLAIAWINGFKPRGDDARPDRGLAPLARMLIGDDCELLTFVYGPAPEAHWKALSNNPVSLAAGNGLWEAILGTSDGVIADGVTKLPKTPRGYLKKSWSAIQKSQSLPLNVNPLVLRLGEQDVDTALHVAFESLGTEIVFEGMCNPPGGDWSGISFRWESKEPEHRWLTLPRVSADGAKRPDHVFALFGFRNKTVCLCIESKETARALEQRIGPRLTRYTEALFDAMPSIHRKAKTEPWAIFESKWKRREILFISAGAYLSSEADPFKGLAENSGLDIQIGVSFSGDGKLCTLHLRGDTDVGSALVKHLSSLTKWCSLVKIES